MNQYKPTNDLYLIKTATHRRQVKYKATTYAASRQGLEDSRFAQLLIQEGNVPCARFGHTISGPDNQVAVLFGGITFPNINSIDLDCSNLYEQ